MSVARRESVLESFLVSPKEGVFNEGRGDMVKDVQICMLSESDG